ncbi:MAG TPA: DUF4169 family protein [Stellaceae bacterium]|jgi:Domain of unknown function (DUF4169)|nr:DUF4169 family protein [Stellaceae bacterium]
MAEIINLNRFKKERDRAAKAKTADENRARFGRSKDERERTEANARKAEKSLDDKKID